MESTTYFCSFSSSWLQTREFFICWKRNLQNTFKIKVAADFCVHSSDISGNVECMKTNVKFCYPVSTSPYVKVHSFLSRVFQSICIFSCLNSAASLTFLISLLSCVRYYCFIYLGTLFSQDTIIPSGQWMFEAITELTLIKLPFQIHNIYTGNIPVPGQYLIFIHFKYISCNVSY